MMSSVRGLAHTYRFGDDAPYFAKAGSVVAVPPQSIGGDTIFAGTQVREPRAGMAGHPDKAYVITGKTADLYVDVTPPSGVQIPLLYSIPHGNADQREIPNDIVRRREQIAADLATAMSPEQRINILKRHAFTKANLDKYVAANGAMKDVKEIYRRAEKAASPTSHVGWERIQRYYKGYRGELNPSGTKRRLLRAVYRPVIMWRAMLRTFRNPDEVGAKGTRTFWSNVPSGIAVSVIVAAMSLAYLSHSERHDKQGAG